MFLHGLCELFAPGRKATLVWGAFSLGDFSSQEGSLPGH
jgi:hypothetical protein